MRVITLLALMAFPLGMKASDALFLSDLEPLLQQQHELWASVTAGFDVRNVGVCPRITVSMNKNWVGKWIAPYSFDARPKGSNGPFIFVIEIHAKTHYFDSKGKEVAIGKAHDIKEDFESITIRKRSQAEIDTEKEYRKNSNR